MRRKFGNGDDDGNIWFTSDTHFGHPGILFMRPWSDIRAMDEALVDGWNSVVGDRDHVFHLGDFSFHRPERTLEILASLKGIKYLIRGNHDRNNLNAAVLSMFDGGVEHYHEITVGSQLITLCHFPFRSWNGMHHDSYNLHGHSHGSMQPIGKQLDVGVDVNKLYRPLSYDEVVEDMKNKKFVRTDHHGTKQEQRTDYVARAAEAYIAAGPDEVSQ
jgi:calcineurin-like phosphoesterase family protein